MTLLEFMKSLDIKQMYPEECKKWEEQIDLDVYRAFFYPTDI